MSKLIRALVKTNSCDDPNGRVQLYCEGVWEETPLVESIGGISLKIDDVVYVDISDGVENPIIIGRAMGGLNTFHQELNGSLLFESSDGSNYTIAFVKCNKLELYNSDGISVVADASAIDIVSDNFTAKIGTKTTLETSELSVKSDKATLETSSGKITGGTFEMQGTSSVDMNGPFCGIKACLFTGAPHCGATVSGT